MWTPAECTENIAGSTEFSYTFSNNNCVFAQYGKNDINFKSFAYYHATFALNLQICTNFLAVHANHMPIC